MILTPDEVKIIREQKQKEYEETQNQIKKIISIILIKNINWLLTKNIEYLIVDDYSKNLIENELYETINNSGWNFSIEPNQTHDVENCWKLKLIEKSNN